MAVSAFTKRRAQENRDRMEGRTARPSSTIETKNVSDFTKKRAQENLDRLASNDLAVASWTRPDAQSEQRMQRARDNLAALTVSGSRELEKARSAAVEKAREAVGKAGTFGGQTEGRTGKAFSGQRKTAEERDHSPVGRAKNTAMGAVAQSIGSGLSALGTGLDLASRTPSYNAAGLALDVAEKKGTASSILREAAEQEKLMAQTAQSAGTAVRDLGTEFNRYGQDRTDQAKAGLGGLGRFAVDTGTGLTQMATDWAIGSLVGGGPMGPMLARSFGAGAEEARQDGASLSQQAQYGMASAMLEAATEKISSLGNIQTAAFGSGAVDDILEGVVAAVERAGKTEAGRKALNRAASAGVGFLSEGAEEFVSGVLSPLLKRGIYSKDPIDWKQTISDAGYEFLTGGAIGAISGGIGGTDTSQIQQAYRAQAIDKAQDDAYRAMAENGAFSGEGRSAVRNALGQIDQAIERTSTGDPFWESVRNQLTRAPASGQETVQNAVGVQEGIQAAILPPERSLTPEGGNDASKAAQAPVQQAQNAGEAVQAAAEIPAGRSIQEANIRWADRRTLQSLSQITGSNIQFVPRAQLEQMAWPGAEGMQLNGQIYISEDAARPYMEIAKHELTHRLQQTAPEQYAAFRDYVADLYRAEGKLDTYVRGAMENAARAGREISEDAALDELAAEYSSRLLTDEKAVSRLAGGNRGLLTRMLDALRDFIARVKTALGGKGNAQTEELEQGAAMWQRMLEASSQRSGEEGDGGARIDDRSKSALSGPPDGGYPKKGGLASEDTLPQPAPEVNTPRTFSDEVARQLGGREAAQSVADGEPGNDASRHGGDQRLATREGTELLQQVDALRRQNQRLREQMKRTHGVEMDEASVRKLSKSLLKDYNSTYAVEDLSGRVNTLYKKIAEQTVSDQEARAEARDIAMDILDGSQTEINPLYDEYSSLRSELRTRAMSIAPEYRADLDAEGGYDSVRKQYMGRLKLTNSGEAIDQVYDDLSTRYPELFPEDVYNPADQLGRIMEVSDELQSVIGSAFEGAEADRTADFLAGDILERFYDTPKRAPTFADRQERRLQAQKTADQQKLLDAVAKERGKKNEALQALKDKHKADNKRRSENRTAAQRREQIIRHSKRLSEKLLRPTDKQHIPENLRTAALVLLQTIDTGSNYEHGPDGRLPVGTGENQIGAQIGIQEIVQTKRTLAARELQAQYEKLLKNDDSVADIMTIDPDLAGYLDEIAEFGDTPLANLRRDQLETIWNAVKAVEASVSRADKVLGQSRYKTVSELAETIRTDNRTKKDRRTAANPVLQWIDKLINVDMMTPETFLHKLGPGGEAIYKSMRKAADRQTTILKEGVDRAKALVEETGVDLNKAAKEMHTFQTEGGASLDLTTAQIMELYALSKREQALDHLYKGGIKPTGAVKGMFQADKAAPVHVTAADVAEMVGALTPEQKRLVDGLQEYLSTSLAEHGNEASMNAYGYKKFKEKNYWPIKADRNQTRTDPNADPVSTAARTVSGYGMAKSLTPKANNAVVLGSALDTFTDHLNEMSTYAAWLGTSEDMNRLLNYRFRDRKGNVEGTFKTLLEQVYGKGGKTYLGSLLTDIAAGTKAGTERSGTDALFNTWKAAKVGGNLRVVFQQPTAIIRAANMIDPKYFAQAKNPMKGWETAVEHSPIAQWKDWGYFELDTGRSLKELIAGTDKVLDKAKNAMMSPAGMADSVAWGHLWNAVEAETADRYKNLQRGSAEFYEKAAERFGEVIDRTQVVDSVLHRTQIMRSGNAVNRMATSFMSEPSKIYNMVYRDIWDLANAEKGQRGKPAKALARSAAALIASFAVNAIAQSGPDAWRDRDRDESFQERFSDAWVGNFLDNFDPIGYIPYLKDMESIIQGYDVSRSDMEGITEIVEAGKDLYKAVNGQSKKTALSSGIDATMRLLDLLGLPAYNIKRDVSGILRHALIDAGAEDLLYELDKLLVNPEKDSKTFYDDLYRTMGKDYDQYKSVYQDMIEQSWTSGDDIKSAMEKRMAKDLGLDKASSLPVEYSPPDSGSFDEEVRRQLERGGSWKDTLPKDSGDLAGRLDQLEPEEGENSVTKRQRIQDIRDAPYSDEAKDLSVRRLLGEKELERYEAAKKAGISVDGWCRLYEDIARAHETRTGKTDSASAQDVALALDSATLTDKQKDAVWESYGWTSDWQDSIAGNGLSDGIREKVAGILSGLEPEEGENAVSLQQKCDAIAESGLSDKDMLGALETVMSAGERKRLNAVYGQGVSPADYVSARGKMMEFDEDGNGTITQGEAKKAIKSMGFLSKEEKAAVWQAQNKTWKPENNPFHKKTGRAVYDALHAGDEED